MGNEKRPARPLRRDELRKYKNLVVVFGSRKYADKDIFVDCLIGFIRDHHLSVEDTVFLSGKATAGPDLFIIEWCQDNGWKWSEFPAMWDDLTVGNVKIKINEKGQQYNALAGFNRNAEMASVGTHGLGFWDGHSPGTRDMMNRCNDKVMKLRMIRVQDDRNGQKP